MAIGAVDDSRDGSLAIVRNVETEVVVVVVVNEAKGLLCPLTALVLIKSPSTWRLVRVFVG